MKYLLGFLTAVLFLTATAFAGSPADNKISKDKESVENYLEGLKSDNFGLQLSSAYYLGEYGCTEAVIPLLRMLKSDNRVEARIVAALALYKLDDARGIYAVKEARKFDDSKRVRKICSLLYMEHQRPIEENTMNLALK